MDDNVLVCRRDDPDRKMQVIPRWSFDPTVWERLDLQAAEPAAEPEAAAVESAVEAPSPPERTRREKLGSDYT